MSGTLISIIVPVFNVEKYLETCLESIRNQTYKDIEIILVNDGSTDKSYEICKMFEKVDNRFILIDKENGGLSSARQAGIERARGEYFCTVDSDDYIEKDFVQKMYQTIQQENADICVCATREYSSDISRIRGFNKEEKLSRIITVEDLKKYYNDLLGKYYMSDSWNKIYRTSFVKDSNIVFSLDKKYNGTDLLFNHLLMLHLPKISIVNEPLYNYQILENSRVRRKNKQLQKGFNIIIRRILKELENLNYSKLMINQISCLYVTLLRVAAQDVFNFNRDSSNLKDKFDEFQYENKEFLAINKSLDLSIKNMNTFSLKLFYYFLQKDNSKPLIRYFNLRQKVLKLKGLVER